VFTLRKAFLEGWRGDVKTEMVVRYDGANGQVGRKIKLFKA
jgi:hypothetical protein